VSRFVGGDGKLVCGTSLSPTTFVSPVIGLALAVTIGERLWDVTAVTNVFISAYLQVEISCVIKSE
jgi:hypothetical protein